MGKKSAEVAIAPLHRYPEAVALLARWHQREWQKLGAPIALASCEEKLRHHLDSAAPLPCTFVACAAGAVIGSASLVFYRRLAGPQRSPWLANLFVREDWRDRGVGSALVCFVRDYARQQQIDRLHLFTTDQAVFYRRRGWTLVRRSHWRQQTVDIMALALTEPPPC